MIESHKMKGNPPKCERCGATNSGGVEEWCSRRLVGRSALLPKRYAKVVDLHGPVKVVGALSPDIMLVDVRGEHKPTWVHNVLPEEPDDGRPS